MALTLTKAPGNMNFAYNPIEVKIETNSFVLVNAVAAGYSITFTAGAVTPGDIFAITFDGITVSMVALNIPVTVDGLHFRIKTGFETLYAWCNSFAIYINGNYFINKYYTVSVDSVLNIVYLTAINGGIASNITDEEIPGTGTWDEISAGVDKVTESNFHIFLKVKIYGVTESGLIEEIPTDMLQLDDENFIVQIHDILQKYVKYEVPEFELGNFATSLRAVNFFKLIYYEAFGNPITAKFIYTSEYYAVINGGLNEIDFPSNTFFSSYVPPYFKFLTWQKRIKKITTAQEEWLYFLQLHEATYTRYALKLEIFYGNATIEIQYLYDYDWSSGDVDYIYPAMHYFETGYEVLVAPVAADDNVVKYKVTVVDFTTHTILSETFTYEIVDDFSSKTKYFLFFNSLGGADTLRTSGERVTGLTVTNEILNKFLNADYAIEDGRHVTSRPESEIKITQRTGWLTKNETDYLVELFVSPRAYEIINHKLIPIIITRKEIQLNAENSKQFGLEFEYTYAYNYNAKKGGVTL